MGKRRTQTKLWNCWEDNHHSTHYHSPSHSSHHFLSKRNRFIQARRPSCWFESTGIAQKEVQTHFSSYSKVAKLDVHIYSTAILLWYFRYTMVDHRDKWAITYKKSSAWLSAQINNKEVEKELLEAARIFVVKSMKKLSDWTNLSKVLLQLPNILSLKKLRRNLKKLQKQKLLR